MIEVIECNGMVNLWRPKQPSPFRVRVESHQVVICPLCDEFVKAQYHGSQGWKCPLCYGRILTEG